MSHPNGTRRLKAAGWSRPGDNLHRLLHVSGAYLLTTPGGLWQAFDREGREVVGSPFVNGPSARTAALTAAPKEKKP